MVFFNLHAYQLTLTTQMAVRKVYTAGPAILYMNTFYD